MAGNGMDALCQGTFSLTTAKIVLATLQSSFTYKNAIKSAPLSTFLMLLLAGRHILTVADILAPPLLRKFGKWAISKPSCAKAF
jgi:hypothetical protein